MEAPLHTLNPLTRFSNRASDYARFRPSYPEEAVDAILADLGPPESLVAADVGAGTGISARWLAERSIRVVAIEPNEPMRSAAAPHPRVEWREGRAESTGLPDGSVDLVLCAQAFHWFEPDSTLREFARILKQGRRLALIWNRGDRSDPLTAAYYRAIDAAATDPQAQGSTGAEEPLRQSSLFANQREHVFRQVHPVTEEGLIGRALSASYIPREGPVAEKLIHDLRAAFREHAGESPGIVYRTVLWLAERA